MKKGKKYSRILSLLLAVCMVFTMMPGMAWADEVSVSSNVIDITDKDLSAFLLSTVTISGATVVSATEDGMVLNVILSDDTNPEATITAGFSGTGKGGYLSHQNNKCTLSNGIGIMNVSVAAMAQGRPIASANYTINFTVPVGEACSVDLPTGEGFTVNGKTTAYIGGEYHFTVTITEGYDGSNMIVKANDEVLTGVDGTYTVAEVTGNLEITVEGVVPKEVCSITLPSETTGYTITGAKTAYKGDSYSFTLTIDNAYKADNLVVKAGETVLEEHDGKYTVAEVTGDFAITVDGIVPKTIYNVTLISGTGYKIAGATTVYEGDNYTFTVTVEEGYSGTSMVVKSGETELEGNGTYTIPNVSADLTITVEGVTEKEKCTVTLPTGEGYTVTGKSFAYKNETYTFTVTVNKGYAGTNMVVKAGDNILTGTDGTYKIEQVTENLTIEVTGVEATGVTQTTIYTGNSKPDKTWGYISSITVDGTQVEEYKWVGDNAYVTLIPRTSDDAVANISFTTGGRGVSVTGEKNISLTDGKAVQSFTAKDTTFKKYTWNFTLHFSNKGFAPTLAEGIEGTSEAAVYVNDTYSLDLAPLFSDIFEKPLTYFVKAGDGEFTAVDGTNYYVTPTEEGTTVLTFKANNGKLDSTDTYVVTLNAQAFSNKTVSVKVPETITPEFYTTESFGEDGTDITGTELTATAGETVDGLVPYTLQVDNLAETISVRAEGWGGMAIPAETGSTVVMRLVETSLIDLAEETLEGDVTVTYGERKAVAGSENRYMLAAGQEYSFTSAPKDAAYQTITEKIVLDEGTDSKNIVLKLGLKDAVTITTTTGATARLYNYDTTKYYVATEYEPKIIADNGDGTTSYYFNANGNCMIYHITMPGKITKAGYFGWNQKSVNVLYTEDDKAASYRLEDYSGTGENNSGFTEDSVLLNINGQNNLAMSVGDTKTLKAYRAWEIIKISYQNYIITPNFHFNILQGGDVISLTDKDSPSVGDGDWKTMTALEEGTAIIEVTYDAVEVKGGNYDGTYGASDSARTGLAVIQVGGHDDSIDFGIESKASAGIGRSSNISYNANAKKAWDAEFDTLYFTGASGKLSLTPTADSAISKVEVSGDKGETWTELTADAGKYTADIVPGNNIIKVTTEAGTAYQVVRGDKIKVRYVEVDGNSDKDEVIEAGETIRIYFDGLHVPIPKMAGNYNPGFGSNNDGYSSHHLNYICNGESIYGTGTQYNFITGANFIEVVVPANGEINLTDGYIGVGVLGLTKFADGGDSHRNIPDSGCGTRDSKTTFHTRSMLPELIITVGQSTDSNNAPSVKAGVPATATIESGKNYAINPETLFTDRDGDTLTFTVAVDNSEAAVADSDYKFAPPAAGTYTLRFTATDGKATAEHTITLTVTRAETPEKPTGPVFNVPGSIGNVTISFEDNAVRKAGETGLKYPVALGTIVPATEVPFKENETIADVTLRLLDAYGIGYDTSEGQYGFYLGAIKNFTVDNTDYDSMGQFDAGNGSGWMITHNNVFIGQSAGNVTVKNKDRIEWKFTCQLGQDIGDPYWDDKKEDEEVKDVTTSGGAAGGVGAAGATGEAVTTTTPTEVTVIGSTATATVTKENVTETIKQATENKAAEIIVQVTESDTKGAAKVEVKLDTATVKEITEKTDAALTVKTENGTVSLDQETLKTVVSEAKGSAVTLEVVKVEKPAEHHKQAAGENGHIIQLVIKSGDKVISSFNEGKATVTVEIPTKLDGKKVAAIHIGDDGKVEHLKGQEVTVGGKKHYRFDTPHFSTFALVDADEIGLEVEEQTMSAEEVKALLADLSPAARSSKTAKGIKVTLKLDAGDKAIIEALEAEGFTVKYKFYRSTKKASKYQAKLTSKKTCYTNTGGKKGTKYYYKARIQVYNADGQSVAQTELKQCKYASRKWTK